MSAIKNVMVVGAGGNLGKPVLKVLLANKAFNTSILTRKSSSSTFPEGAKVYTVADDYPTNELVPAFEGQDAIVVAIGQVNVAEQKSMIDAAIAAGVRRYIPAEFGFDTRNPKYQALVPLLKNKADVMDYLRTKESATFSWTALATGPFFDWGLQTGFMGFDISGRKATIYDDGINRFGATTLPAIGTAVARVLETPAETANRYLLVSEVTTDQNEILAALERVTGATWEVTHVTTEELKSAGQAKLAQGDFSGIVEMLLTILYGKGNENTVEDTIPGLVDQRDLETIVQETVAA